jgi:FXSXX-COOH protein
MGNTGTNGASHTVRSDLPDLSGLTFSQVDVLGDSVLAHAVRRVLREMAHPEEPEVAAFDSAIA